LAWVAIKLLELGHVSVISTLEINNTHNNELNANQPKVVSLGLNNQITKQIMPKVIDKIILISNKVLEFHIFV
jgi:hypothetical protein